MSASTFPFTGTGVALVTPFKKSESIDFDALGRIIDYNISNGVNYFAVLGTTGESATLTKKEKEEVFSFVSSHVNGRVKLLAGLGGNNTNELVDALESFTHKGYDAVLSVSPYYNKPSQEGIYQHYKKLSAASPLPIILYNVPGRTGSNMTAETVLKLANEHENIIAVKEASGNISQAMQIIKHQPKHFNLVSGDDNITLPLMSVGAVGVISVVAQAFPKVFSKMMNKALEGDYNKASKHHYRLLDSMELFFTEGSPGGVKAALHKLGLCDNVLRLPLVQASKGLYEKISHQVNALMDESSDTKKEKPSKSKA